MFPGEIINGEGQIIINKGRRVERISVKNTADRPVQVGSHFHFFEINRFLEFDRAKAYGMRLDIPSGTSVRFEPGEEKEIQLVELAGNKRVFGLNNLTVGQATPVTLKKALHNAQLKGFVE